MNLFFWAFACQVSSFPHSLPFPPPCLVKLCAGSFCLILFNMRVRRVIFDSSTLWFFSFSVFSIFCTLKCRCQQSSIGGDKWALRTESHLHKLRACCRYNVLRSWCFIDMNMDIIMDNDNGYWLGLFRGEHLMGNCFQIFELLLLLFPLCLHFPGYLQVV